MIDDPWQEGTSQVKRSGGGRRVKVSADGRGVVSHAGTALLRELAVETGLAGEVTATLIDTSLLEHSIVWIGAGTPHHLASLPPGDLARLAGARTFELTTPG